MLDHQHPTDTDTHFALQGRSLSSDAATLPAAFIAYETAIQASREAFEHDACLERLFSSTIREELLERFLLFFCVQGLAMVEPVDGWIRRAGERCVALDLSTLGRTLIAHARHEEGHDRLMLADAYAMAARISQRKNVHIDVDALLSRPHLPGVIRYRKVHEDFIASDAPYGQIAIEYEIERLSLTMGPRLVSRCVDTLGQGIFEALTFLTEHVELDLGHTRLNERAIARLLEEHPEFVEPLVAAGSEALSAYAEFLRDCLHAAELELEEAR